MAIVHPSILHVVQLLPEDLDTKNERVRLFQDLSRAGSSLASVRDYERYLLFMAGISFPLLENKKGNTTHVMFVIHVSSCFQALQDGERLEIASAVHLPH